MSKDFGAVTVLGDTSATEMDATNAAGSYMFDLTQGESNADCCHFTGKSTGNTRIVPQTFYTDPPNYTTLSVDGSGRVDVIKVAGTTQTAGDLATLITAVDDFVDTEVAAIKAKTDLIPGTQDGKTFAQTMLLMAAALLGKASGMATTTAVFRAVDDSKDRITATVDANGNRSAVTLDAT